MRVKLKHDLTTERGVQFVLRVISAWCGHRRLIGAKMFLLLWVSIPCTGGSPWNRLNKMKSKETRDKIKAHVTLFSQLCEATKVVAQKVSDVGGVSALEWPKGCDYWKFQAVQEFISLHGLKIMEFDSCAFGLVAKFGTEKGTPIRKPWRVDSNCEFLLQNLDRQCNKSHDHAPCAGRDTKVSARYTSSLVAAVHAAFCSWCRFELCAPAP